jgi:molybdate transport system substrate-binding protein
VRFGLGILLVFAHLGMAGCSKSESEDQSVVTLLAATSLKKPIDALIKELKSVDAKLEFRVSYAGSQDLAAQIAAGAPADLFVSAGNEAIDQLVTKGLVDRAQAKPFARNKLAIAFRSDLKLPLTSIEDLSRPGLKLVMGDEKVPIGKFSREFLERWDKDRPGRKGTTLINVVSFEPNDLALVSKVRLGEADAAIVYASDLYFEAKLKILEIPREFNPVGIYFAAVLKRATGKPGPEFLFKHLMHPKVGQRIMLEYGFSAASPAEYGIDEPNKGG